MIRLRTICALSKWVVPAMLAVAGVWFLVGCLYIPSAEHPDDPHQVDFRPLFRSSSPPIEMNRTTKAQLLSILGNHLSIVASRDDSLEVYVYQTDQGSWINLCGVFPVARNEACLAVLYNENGIITDWQFVEMPAGNIFGDLALKLKPTLRERFVEKLTSYPPAR